MRLTTFSDCALRTLMYLALHENRYVPIAEIAAAWRMSPNHLMKVVRHLGVTGHVTTLRGPHGGVRLSRSAGEIRLGAVLRGVERDLILAPPDAPSAADLIAPVGPWAGVLAQALAAFIGVLDDHTLADLVADPGTVTALLATPERPAGTG